MNLYAGYHFTSLYLEVQTSYRKRERQNELAKFSGLFKRAPAFPTVAKKISEATQKLISYYSVNIFNA